MNRFRSAPRAPLAVAGILAMPLFFVSLMALSLALEKPSVQHVLEHGRLVAKLGDPPRALEGKIWLVAVLPALGLVLVGTGAMLLGRLGVVVSALAAVAGSVALLLPLPTWVRQHAARFPISPRGGKSGRCKTRQAPRS